MVNNNEILSKNKKPEKISYNIKRVKTYGPDLRFTDITEKESNLLENVISAEDIECKHDPALSLAARMHAENLADNDEAKSAFDLDRIHFYLQKFGGVDYAIDAVLLNYQSPGKSLTFPRISRDRQKKWTHCGIAPLPRNNQKKIVLLGVNRSVKIENAPVTVKVPGKIVITGKVLNSAGKNVKAFVGFPDQSVKEISPAYYNMHQIFKFVFSAKTKGRYDVELVIEKNGEPVISSLFYIYADILPPNLPLVTPEIDESLANKSNESLLGFLNNARIRHKLKILKRHKTLDRLALLHSREMLELKYFGHISPRNGNLKKRLENSNFFPSSFAENIAQSWSTFRIHKNLMNSPWHRKNILNLTFTHVGIGVAKKAGQLTATYIFAQITKAD